MPFKDKKIREMINSYLPPSVPRDEVGNAITPKYRTGIGVLDSLMGGGFPQGHAVGFATVEGGGKTTLAIQAGCNIIEEYGKYVYYFDVEGGCTPELFSSMGLVSHLYDPEVNPTGKFIVMSVKTIQEIATLLKFLVNYETTGLVVIDSTTLTADQLQLEDEQLGTGKNSVGAHARMWSNASRQINAIMPTTKAALLLIHQARENLSGFRVQTEAARGRGLKHLVSIDIFGTIGRFIDENGNEITTREGAVGAVLRLTTTKNRMTKPYQKVQLPLFYGRGASNRWAYAEWLQTFVMHNADTGEIMLDAKGQPVYMLNKSGSWFDFYLPSGHQKVQGMAKVNELIDEHIEEIVAFIDANGGLANSKNHIEMYVDDTIKASLKDDPGF